MSKPLCPASTLACENEELCATRGCVRMDPPLQAGKPPPLPIRDLRERVRRLILLGMGSMLAAGEKEQEAYLRMVTGVEAAAPSGLHGDLLLTVNAVIAEVTMAVDEVRRPGSTKMRDTLQRAAELFEDYARQHRAKGTPEGDEKAERNAQMAALCRDALGSMSG